jgi:hypothetical protein
MVKARIAAGILNVNAWATAQATREKSTFQHLESIKQT